jgi:hypothetical protein
VFLESSPKALTEVIVGGSIGFVNQQKDWLAFRFSFEIPRYEDSAPACSLAGYEALFTVLIRPEKREALGFAFLRKDLCRITSPSCAACAFTIK